MPIEVEAPDGTVVEFPDGTSPETMRAAMQRRYGRPQAPAARPPARPAPSAFDRTLNRRRYERAPQGAPGSFTRALEDFNRSGPTEMLSQMFRNIGVADELAGASEFLQSGGNAEAARAGAQYENQRRDQVARDQPVLNAASVAASVPAFAGAPAAAGPVSMLQAGLGAAGTNAPFALARQEGSLQERLPGAALETAAVGAFGAGLQGAANRLLRPRVPRTPNAPTTPQQRAQQFEQAGVRPTMAAVAQGTPAGATRLISENFFAGGPARARIQASLDDTAGAAEGLAREFGQPGQPEQVGEAVQRGVQRFSRERPEAPANAPRTQAGNVRPELTPTRDWSFRAKADALYDHAEGPILADEAAHLAGQTGVRATTENAERVLAEIQNRVTAPNVAEMVRDPTIVRVAQALEADRDAMRFHDIRELRRWVREARDRPGLTQSVDQASLARLEQALTQDIYQSAMDIGGEAAAARLRRVDQFYRAGQNRITRALQAFDPQRTGGRQAYERIIALAGDGARQNTRSLQSLRNSLRGAEWREVAATVIEQMGRPTAGAANALESGAFSVDRFVTAYARLSPEGRRILFGGNGTENLAQALDNLAQVAGYQKGVEAMANRSRSGVNAQNIGSGLALVNPGTMPGAAALLGGMALTGEMLTNPAFVRWLVSAPRASGAPGGMRRHLAALAQLASRDPALAPLYADLAERAIGEDRGSPAPASSPATRTEAYQ